MMIIRSGDFKMQFLIETIKSLQLCEIHPYPTDPCFQNAFVCKMQKTDLPVFSSATEQIRLASSLS